MSLGRYRPYFAAAVAAARIALAYVRSAFGPVVAGAIMGAAAGALVGALVGVIYGPATSGAAAGGIAGGLTGFRRGA